MAVTRHNIIPLYVQIADELAEQVRLGGYEPSGLLPSEATLGTNFGVSRVTVRLAIGLLAQRGLVERRRGKGTFVKRKRLQHGLNTLRGFHDELVLKGLDSEMRLLSVETRPLTRSLRTAMRTRRVNGLFLRRLHSVQGEPIAIASTWLPPDSTKLTRAELEKRSSYAVIETLLGWQIERARLGIRLEAAAAATARLLSLKPGASVIILERTSYLNDGRSCEQTFFEIRPERFEFILDTHGPGYTDPTPT